MTVEQVKLSCSLDKSAMVIDFAQLPHSKSYPTALNSLGMTKFSTTVTIIITNLGG